MRGLAARDRIALAIFLCGAAAVFLGATAACSTGQKESLMRFALDADERRQELLEATLRVLDDHPEYVDELFAMAEKHPDTLERFIENAVENLDEEELAMVTAEHLARNPASLKMILVETIRASEADPAARAAIAAALGAEVELTTDILTDDPELVTESMIATVHHVMKKREARTAFVKAMWGTSPALAAILVNNPKLMTQIFQLLIASSKRAPSSSSSSSAR
jgi:hypothetical protein